jgi:hypothetical protein
MAVEATAAVLVREHKGALSQMPALILNVNEVGEGDVVVQLDCEVDDAVKDIAKGAVDSSSGLDHSTNSVAVGHAARNPDSRQRLRWRPPMNQALSAAAQGTPTCNLARAARQGPSA